MELKRLGSPDEIKVGDTFEVLESFKMDFDKYQKGKFQREEIESEYGNGFYYTVKAGELIRFERTNGWDLSYFSVVGKGTFVMCIGSPDYILNHFKLKKIIQK